MRTLYGLDLRPGGRLVLAPNSLELVAGLTVLSDEGSSTLADADVPTMAAFVWAQQAAWTLWAQRQSAENNRPDDPAGLWSEAARRLPAAAVRLLRAPKDRPAPIPLELVWMPDWPICFVTPRMLSAGTKAPVGTVSLPLTPTCALHALVKTNAIETGIL